MELKSARAAVAGSGGSDGVSGVIVSGMGDSVVPEFSGKWFRYSLPSILGNVMVGCFKPSVEVVSAGLEGMINSVIFC